MSDEENGSCYDDNEYRPPNYYHDKQECDCALCNEYRADGGKAYRESMS